MNEAPLPVMTAQFGLQPDHSAAIGRLRLHAAIWSSPANAATHELAGPADHTRHVVSVALSRYRCEAFVDGNCRYAGNWQPGDVQLMQAGVVPRGVFGGSWRVLHIYIPHITMSEALGVQPGTLELTDPLGRQDRQFATVGLAFARAMLDQTLGSRLEMEAMGLSILAKLARHWSNLSASKSGKPERGGLAPYQLKRACEAMGSQFDADLSLDDLAAIAGCSPTHFSRAFKQSTGLAPFRWLIERRIEKAKRLLEENRLSLAEIALAVGFSAQPQFTTAFSRVTGLTPGAWRREQLT